MFFEQYAVREIRGLNQGETCNFRAKAECNAPVFKVVPGGEWTSNLDQFNITFVEYEEENINLVSASAPTLPSNSWMPKISTKFIYQMYDIVMMEAMERSYNMENVKNNPRKGIYSNKDEGYKAFNNIQQGASGKNAFKEDEDDQDCKPRYVLVSVTALEDNSSVNVIFGSHLFSRRPILSVTRTSAVNLTTSVVLALSALISLSF